jgi:phosphatidylinositol phospholipase C delta
MAETLIRIFGDKLLRSPVDSDETVHPSPEDLLGKIIIKGKKLKNNSAESDDGEVSDEDEASECAEYNDFNESPIPDSNKKRKKTVSEN